MGQTGTREAELPATIDGRRVENLASSLGEPIWLKESRLAAWQTYCNTPLPTRADEQWRFTDIKSLNLAELRAADFGPLSSGTVKLPAWHERAKEFLKNVSAELVLVKSSTASLSIKEELEASGVIVCDMATAVREHPEKVRPYLEPNDTPLATDKFTLMNRALFNIGFFIYIPPGLELSEPVLVSFALGSKDKADRAGEAVFPHSLIVAGESSRAQVIVITKAERAPGLKGPALSLSHLEVFLDRGASLSCLEVKDLAQDSYAIDRTHHRLSKDSSLTSLTAALGAACTKADIIVQLDGPGAAAELSGIIAGAGREHFDFNTVLDHRAPDSTSNINFRVALDDSSSSVYRGTIKVDKDAARTSAYQSNRNLLLGSEAQADTIPNLEILTNDVHCSHGATVGPVDKEQLFYIMSRGMQAQLAEELIVLGFFIQLLERFGNQGVATWLAEAVSGKYRRGQA